jgi:hypothetical protein
MAAGALVLTAASCKRQFSQRLLVDEVRTNLAGCLVHVSYRSLDQTLRPAVNTSVSPSLPASYRVCKSRIKIVECSFPVYRLQFDVRANRLGFLANKTAARQMSPVFRTINFPVVSNATWFE